MPDRAHIRHSLRARIFALACQMDWLRGLRAATAICAPLVLGDLASIPNLGWAALGGFEAIIADTGGPYRSRMSSLATLVLGGAAGLYLGSLAGGNLLWALPMTVLWCFLWSYLAVLGQPFSTAGILVQVVYICGIGAPAASWRVALAHSLLLVAGGAWAALLSLFLWPLDAYRPARSAVGICYHELAAFLAAIADLSQHRPNAAHWHRLARQQQSSLRRAIEHGWQAVAAIRATRQAETAQGHHLVVLLEHADLLLVRTVALAEHIEAQATSDGASPCHKRRILRLEPIRVAEEFVNTLLVGHLLLGAAELQKKRSEMQLLPITLDSCLNLSDATDRFFAAQITEAASLLEIALESAAMLRSGLRSGIRSSLHSGRRTDPLENASVGHFGYVYERLSQLRQGWNPGRIFDQLYANLTRRSILLRHALRVALVCGLDVVLIQLLHIDHGYWLLLTSLIVLQPHVSGTLRRGMERIGGTIAGGILAAILAVTLHSQLAIAAALFPLALLSLAILPVSYTAFSFFLTPTFVLAWLPFSGDWQLALIRTANTILGAGISVAAMLFLFPAYERERSHEFLCASLRADRNYLKELAESWRARSRSSRQIANARRATGLAHNDTEESMDRLLAESWPHRRPFAQFVASFVTYLRRFAQSVTTLAALDGEWEWKQSAAVQARLHRLDRRMAWLEAQTEAQTESQTEAQTANHPTPAEWPQPSGSELQEAIPSQNHPGERQLKRLERQAEILYRQLLSLRRHGWLLGTLPEKASDSPSQNP